VTSADWTAVGTIAVAVLTLAAVVTTIEEWSRVVDGVS
jgi:hypothetical protein